jgi:hypothetical protein
MPHLDASAWTPAMVAEQTERLEAQGAQPRVVVTIYWRSAAERAQDAQDQADETYLSTLRAQAVKRANRIRYQR